MSEVDFFTQHISPWISLLLPNLEMLSHHWHKNVIIQVQNFPMTNLNFESEDFRNGIEWS